MGSIRILRIWHVTIVMPRKLKIVCPLIFGVKVDRKAKCKKGKNENKSTVLQVESRNFSVAVVYALRYCFFSACSRSS